MTDNGTEQPARVCQIAKPCDTDCHRQAVNRQAPIAGIQIAVNGNKENRLCIIPQQRDDELMERFDLEIPKFIAEMDEHLNKLGFAFGDQWSNN